jgi:methylmalonyl-CoA/ethylmalonyl-CoA epimerase
MLEGVHHINFLVADLDTAILRYKDLFDIEAMTIESLPERGVRTARFKLSGVWIVLDAATVDLTAKGAIDKAAKSREGLQGWRVIDLEPDAVFGALIQLTQEK